MFWLTPYFFAIAGITPPSGALALVGGTPTINAAALTLRFDAVPYAAPGGGALVLQFDAVTYLPPAVV